MTKKKQSKRSAKQAAKKPVKRPGVDATLQEIPAALPSETNGQNLSAPEPFVTEPSTGDIAAVPTLSDSIAVKVEVAELEEPELESAADAEAARDSDSATGSDSATDSDSATGSVNAVGLDSATDSHNATGSHNATVQGSSADSASVSKPEVNATVEKPHTPTPFTSISPSITNDIPTGLPEPSTPEQSSSSILPQVTSYDIAALGSTPNQTPTDAGAIQLPPAITPIDIAPLKIKTQPLGSLTRSKSSSEVSKALTTKEENAYKWKAPVDYFGASASAFSSSFTETTARDTQQPNPPSPIPSAPFTPMTSSVPPMPQVPAQPSVPHTSSVPATPSVPPQFMSAHPSVPGSSGSAPSAPAASGSSISSAPSAPPGLPVAPAAAAPSTNGLPPDITPGLSPKMAKFVSSLREREMTASAASSPTLPQIQAEKTAVDISPIPSPVANPSTPATSVTPPVSIPPQPVITPLPRQEQSRNITTPKHGLAGPALTQTARDLTPAAKPPVEVRNEGKAPLPDTKAFKDEEPLSPNTSSYVAELRESIISQRESKPEDWHPVTQKKGPRAADPTLSSELDALKKNDKSKQEGERHYTLEELAAMDPELALPPQTVQQQSIRRLKSKTTAGVRFEIYLAVYILCLGLSWVAEQSAAAGTCRDAGWRIESAIQLITPKPLADNFMAGSNAFDDREIRLHPFNPNKRPNFFQIILNRISAFCSGLSSAFGRIPALISNAGTANPLAQAMILLSYSSILILSLLIYFKFRRSVDYGVADLMLLPICLIAASSAISAVISAVLSMSASLAAGYLPNTIVLFTTIAIVLSALDMARRSFLGRKQAIVRD